MPWSDAIFVTGDAVRGTWMSPDMVNRKWKVSASRPALVGTQGQPLSFNDLRHTFASLAMRHHTLELMSLASTLGHKDVSVTLNIYADAYEELKRAGMLAMDETL